MKGRDQNKERSILLRMNELDIIGDVSAVTSVIFGLLALLIAVNQFSAMYFHVTYLLTLAFVSVHLVVSTVLGKNRLAVLTAVILMVCFGMLTTGTASVPYPIIASTDTGFELQNVNRILSTGMVQWGQGTGYGADYSYFPGMEILVALVALVSRIPQVALLKYGGSFVCVIPVLFLYGFYSSVCSSGLVAKRQFCGLAAALAALSPWFIAFDAGFVHQTVALVFLGMVLLSWSEPRGGGWILVALFGVAGIAITHAFTSYVLISLLLVLGATAWMYGKSTSTGLPNLTNIGGTIAVVVVAVWSVFVAFNYLPEVTSYIAAATDYLISPKLTLSPVTPSGSKPLWIVALTYVGFATYFFLAFGTFLRRMLRRNAQERTTVWLALPGFLFFGALLAPYLAGLTDGVSLLGRGLIYLYFFTAPLVAQFLGRRLIGVVHEGLTFRFSRRTVLAVGLIFVILAPSVYYGVYIGYYDRSSPMVSKIDIRLSPGEWQAVADLSRVRISAHVVYGVRLAFDYVGAIGLKEVYIISVPVGGTLFEWVQQHPNVLIFLRMSIVRTPDFGYVSENDLLSTLNHANVLYSSGDVVILENP